jgi:hypothetical protein
VCSWVCITFCLSAHLLMGTWVVFISNHRKSCYDGVQMSVCISASNFFAYVSGRGISGSYGNSMGPFKKKWHDFPSSCSFGHSYQQCSDKTKYNKQMNKNIQESHSLILQKFISCLFFRSNVLHQVVRKYKVASAVKLLLTTYKTAVKDTDKASCKVKRKPCFPPRMHRSCKVS